MNNLTVNQFINYFGGFDKVVIENQEILDKKYWWGTVDDWLDYEDKGLGNEEVITASIVDNQLVLRIFKD